MTQIQCAKQNNILLYINVTKQIALILG